MSVCALSVCALAFAGSSALAADWSGVYVGGTVGGAFGHTKFALPGDTADRQLIGESDTAALVGGGLVGFNYQSNNIVVGVESDVTTGDATAKSTDCTVFGGCFTSAHDSFTTYDRLKNGTTERARVRLGWADGATLVYVAGGYSAAQTQLDLIGDCYNAATPATPTVYRFSRSKDLSGYNLGAGIEHVVARHWVGRFEYIYDGFGDQTYRGDGSEWNDRRLSISSNTVRAALAYKF
jgi:outer membrane immunogenic protein